MDQARFLRSTKYRGGKDPILEKLTELGFPILDIPKGKGDQKSWSRPPSLVRNKISSHTTYQELALHRIIAPPVVNFLPYLAKIIMVAPWAATISLLALMTYHPLPSSLRNNFPKFSTDGRFMKDWHIKAFLQLLTSQELLMRTQL